jgi:F-type H+-transporting ATPase subunit a
MKCDSRTTLDGGILGGGITSFYDFSISKNVLAMLIVALLMIWMFVKAAKRYATHPTSAPSGIQGFLEPLFLFIRDEVAIPFIGIKKYKKYLPLLMSIFFFILGLNLFGQIPFLGSTNVTGNLTVTMILAILVAIIVNISGNKDYWQHVFWMPGVPVAVKPLLAVVEIMSLFIKPLTLMLRLAGNISAGHIAILSFIGLIFIFGNSGASIGGGAIGTAMAIPLTLFMMAIELIVAFVQAFVFTILTASYIGAAIEEHAHH